MRIVGGKWKGHPLEAPSGKNVTRPTTDRVREAMASMILSSFGLDLEGVRVLDGFAGTGALGMEMLSRGAASCTFVDRDRKALSRIAKNLKSVGAQASCYQLLGADSFQLGQIGPVPGAPFDLVLLDPPYACKPQQVAQLLCGLKDKGQLAEEPRILYEHGPEVSGLELEGLRPEKSKKYGTCLVDLYLYE